MEKKVCIKCGMPKDATTEFFQEDKRLLSGLTGKCRICINEYYKMYNRKGGADRTRVKTYGSNIDVEVIPIPEVILFKGHSYSIQTPKANKEVIGRRIKGEVIQVTESLITIKTKNYIESFSRFDLAQYEIMEV